MGVASSKTLFDEVTDLLASSPTPEQILDFHLSSQLEKRALDLLERNKQEGLSPEERAEMLEFIRMDDLLSLLKAKTRLRLVGK